MSIIVVFRSCLRPEHADEYGAEAKEMAELARAQSGIIAFKTFAATDGERVTIAEFVDEAAVVAWRENARHKEAQTAGRERFYAEYRVQVCEVLRDYGYEK
ncbi:MAG: antibiotic biosynthesis monooxygenase [Armatimonadetes bacterium]|nr:antibiotic biosynthesis monooxygenase [Armatimonadota bacterium]